jgi:predicted molibdopterin-dependent oxidoreductase YjgC
VRRRAVRPRADPGTAGRAGPDSAGLVQIQVDGRAVAALDGQSVAGALHQAGIAVLRRNPVTGEPRGAFCGMGVCFECEVTIDGVPGARACMTHVSGALRIETSDHDAPV